jgi:aryl-alcohol dehydrogenase-like predicted oxidoreductase
MVTRRHMLTALGAATVAASLTAPAPAATATAKTVIPRRILGRTGRLVTPLGLGGQAALQWTPPGTDPADIIVRAVELGVTYLDTSNVYGDSQLHYGEAFRRLNLAPGKPGFDAAKRESLFLATKTHQRFARDPSQAGYKTAVDDIRRSLTQIFGDGQGYIPDGAYLDLIQMHAVGSFEEVEQLYLGMKERKGGKMPDKIGAFAALLDYRDGTDYTGLNPDHKRWVRHVGVSGHFSAPVLMNMLRRDEGFDLDTLLVALNVADKLYLPHQNNVLPLAVARGMGVIAMKVFADGVFMGKGSHWSRTPGDVVTTVGNPNSLNYHDMIRYTASLPGVSTAIIGIGHIDRLHPEKDQLVADLAAAIDAPMDEAEREKLERQAAAMFGPTTNFFQDKAQGLTQPTGIALTTAGERVMVSWQAGYAGAKPILSWQIRSGGKTLLAIPFRPQLTLAPLTAYLDPADIAGGSVEVLASETI